ncbi:c-type cytochrome [Sphingomonas sp.]|uniref:c-type cytochrome n=1 Tax=Sphingomonas sp. TaxID=28214 RepID=UPI00286AFE46|nr:c-type cytochrome [Sphingomonas sp.]
MRRLIMLLAVASLSGCDSRQSAPTAPMVKAALTFDGAVTKDPAALVKHGERIASVLGCRGCHTPTLQGQRFYELYASNLTREMPNYSDAQFKRLMHRGEHPAGRELWGMPSEIFQHLGDADLAALTAFLRTLKPAGPPTGKPLPFEGDAQKLIAEGKMMPAAQSVVRDRNLAPPDLGARHALGRYITMVTCAECHGPELKGNPGDTPDLIVASGYSRADFEKFMTTGVPSGNRKLKNELMSVVAQSRFSKMTVAERDAVPCLS